MNTGLLIIFLFLGLMALRVPVAFGMLLSALVYILYSGNVPKTLIPQSMINGSASYTVMASPFFILVGELMNSAGITKRIFRFANVLVGHFRGGLGHVNILASVFFAGVSGSAVADAAGLGNVEIKAMVDEGYDADFSVGITAASSTIGPIIPPSNPLVLYGILTGTSIGSLFIAGIPTGLVMALFMMFMVYYLSRRRNYPTRRRSTWGERWTAFRESFWSLLTPLILIGGMLSGYTTPTETAAVAVAYSLMLGFVIYKELKLRDLSRIMQNAIRNQGMVLLLIASGTVFAWMVSREKIAEYVAEMLMDVSDSPYVLLLFINLFLLFVGTFMETSAGILITVPILFPISQQLGIDPVQFGVCMILNLMIGLLTPPMALVLFVTSKIGNIPFDRAFKAVSPYYIALLITLALINIFPQITLLLVK